VRRAAAADLTSPRRSPEGARLSGADGPMRCRWARAVLRSLSQRAVAPRPRAMTQTERRRNPPASTSIINIRSPWCGRGEFANGCPRRRPDDPADQVERQQDRTRHDINRYVLLQAHRPSHALLRSRTRLRRGGGPGGAVRRSLGANNPVSAAIDSFTAAGAAPSTAVRAAARHKHESAAPYSPPISSCTDRRGWSSG
jgi:hypothetical protein